MPGQEINLMVRIMPKGEVLEVELPLLATGRQIIEEILEYGAAPRTDPEGTPYSYELISKRTNAKIEDQTLDDCGIHEGETLFLTPKLVAGQADHCLFFPY